MILEELILQQDSINQVIGNLQSQIDSLSQVITTSGPVKDREILQSVNSFYDSAWNKLVFVVSGMFVVVGLLIPYLTNLFQTKSFDKERGNIVSLVETQIVENIRKTVRAEITPEIEMVADKAYEANGAAMVLFGARWHDKKDYSLAFVYYISAAKYYINCKKGNAAVRCLEAAEKCLPLIDKRSEIAKACEIISVDPALEILSEIKRNDIGDSKLDLIRKIEEGINAVKE